MTREHDDGTVIFRFYRPNVSRMSLVGDFNDWDPEAMPMAAAPDGWWEFRLRLAPGTYQFKYHGDGQWFTDFAAFGVERGPYGWNSVLTVHDTRLTAAA